MPIRPEDFDKSSFNKSQQGYLDEKGQFVRGQDAPEQNATEKPDDKKELPVHLL